MPYKAVFIVMILAIFCGSDAEEGRDDQQNDLEKRDNLNNIIQDLQGIKDVVKDLKQR